MLRSLARWLVVGALAAFGFVLGASNALAQDGAEVQGQNTSNAGLAATGGANGSNNSAFDTGPTAAAQDNASSQQLGTNDSTVNQSGTAETGDPVAGGQVTGVVGNATVQNQNNATGNVAVAGSANVNNTAAVNQGPSAVSETGNAQANQAGSNRATISQASAASTGDAVAGAQVTGIAGAERALVQNQNSSTFGLAISGTAVANNLVVAQLGPSALTSGPPAQSSQIGRNDVVLTQGSVAESGDAVANSQVTGAVGSSDFTVQNQNSSQFGFSFSGLALANSAATVSVGGFASSVDPTGGTARAQAAQTGGNSVVADQVSGSSTGDALAGAQVTGLVASEQGQLRVQNQQTSDVDFAFSGIAVATTNLDAVAGPEAFATSSDGTDGGNAQAFAAQLGGNSVDAAQATDAQTGDAVAGGQIVGTVGGSDIEIQNQNTANVAVAVSGIAVTVANANALAGPIAGAAASGTDTGGNAGAFVTQSGDNRAAVSQVVGSATGDAVAGGQVTGTVAGTANVTIQNQNNAQATFAFSGFAIAQPIAVTAAGPLASATATGEEGGTATANAAQAGNNTAIAAQAATLETGDAVSGAQVSGVVVGAGSNVNVQGQNSATGALSVSGFGISVPVAIVVAGPEANAIATGAGDDAVGGTANANAAQIGNNLGIAAQSVDLSTGDAVSGAQIAGVVAGAGSAINVQNQNDATGTLAVSGFGLALPIGLVNAGPVAGADAAAVGVDTATAGTANANVTQLGDNGGSVAQAVSADTGDAVSGSQITGAVAGAASTINVQNQNNNLLGFAFSGPVVATTTANAEVGPAATALAGAFAINADATGGDASANAQQAGINWAGIAQAVDASSGDAVSGSQITGTVAGAGSTTTVQGQNSSSLSLALSGFVTVANSALAVLGPQAIADATAFSILGAEADGTTSAQAGQIGWNRAGVDQIAAGASGDAVVGSQVVGMVGGASRAQIQNDSAFQASFSGAVDTANNIAGALGPVADSPQGPANAQQAGSSSAGASQVFDSETGDSLTGAQVTGAVV